MDDSSIEDYVKTYKAGNPDYLDVKVYDDDHIVVTMYKTDRLKAVKEIIDNLDEYVSSLLSEDDLKDVFTGIETDKLHG